MGKHLQVQLKMLLLKYFKAIAVFLLFVNAAKGSLKDANDKFADLTYTVGFLMTIENQSQHPLSLHKFATTSGQVSYSFMDLIGHNGAGGFVGHKTPNTATGCAGTVTFTITNTDPFKYLTIMYSVPYSQDFYSNWMGLWIHGLEEMRQGTTLFNSMYYKDESLGFKR